MDALPTALFLVPGAFGAVIHRFATAQRLSSGAQLLLAVIYSAVAYAVLGTPLGSAIRTVDFPAALFTNSPGALASPDIGARLLILAAATGVLGLVVGRATTTDRAHAWAAWITGRNLYSVVWTEAFRAAPGQWIRMHGGAGADLVGLLESASDDPDERAFVFSRLYAMVGDTPNRVVGDRSYVRADAFPVVILLGGDARRAVERSRSSPPRGNSVTREGQISPSK